MLTWAHYSLYYSYPTALHRFDVICKAFCNVPLVAYSASFPSIYSFHILLSP